MTLRVGLDVTCLLTGTTGVARLATELGAALQSTGEVELVPYAIGRGPHPLPAGVRHVRIPLRVVHRTWRHLHAPRIERLIGPVDVVHSLDLAPPPTRHPTVLNVHDLAALERPDLHSPRAVRQQEVQLAHARTVDGVLTISEATADALVSRGVERRRVHVVHLGVTALPPPSATPVVEPPYVLAVGSVDARKGTATLVRAFARLTDLEHRLVLVGPDLYRSEEVAQLAAPLGDRVIRTGYVDDRTLSTLYAGADAFCFPSLAEGFGLPVVEALGAGVPVVTSDLAAVREITGGDAAVHVPPGDDVALAAALRQLLGDPDRRRALAAGGPLRAAGFTWAEAARRTLEIYRAVVEPASAAR